MTDSHPIDPGRPDPATRSGARFLPALVFALATVAAARGFYDDGSEPGTAVLGGFRDREFYCVVALCDLTLCCVVLGFANFSRLLLQRLLLAHGAVGVTILGLELAARCGAIDFRAILTPDRGHQAGNRGIPSDPRLAHVGRPHAKDSGLSTPDLVAILGAKADPVPFEFATDRFGLRSPKDKDDPRILCLGDSMLVGGLVPVASLLTERLEAKLGRSVLNVAEVGYSPAEELIRLETTQLSVRERLVVQFVFEGNDLQDTARFTTRSPGASNWPENGLVKSLARMLHRPRLRAGAVRHGEFADAADHHIDVYFLYDAAAVRGAMSAYPLLESTLREANAKITHDGGRYAIALIPMKLRVLHDLVTWPSDSALLSKEMAESPLPDALERTCRDAGIPYLDLTPALAAAARAGRLPYFAADTHLDATGHQVIADAVAPWILTLQPQ